MIDPALWAKRGDITRLQRSGLHTSTIARTLGITVEQIDEVYEELTRLSNTPECLAEDGAVRKWTTWDDIETLGRNSVPVASMLSLVRSGTCTREQAMMELIPCLVEQNDRMVADNLRLSQLARPESVILPG